jgi:hypothetical protein
MRVEGSNDEAGNQGLDICSIVYAITLLTFCRVFP